MPDAGRKFAIVVAVEKYNDPTNVLTPVLYAEADATAVRAALIPLGFDAKDLTLLVNGTATKTSIEGAVSKVARAAREEDTVYFFYAGHGFAERGLNYLTCVDTDPTDATTYKASSVRLKTIYDKLKKSKAKRIAMFLDTCESGMRPGIRSVISKLAGAELEKFMGSEEFAVCFSSSKEDESSRSLTAYKHGIWTYHLLEALEGRAPTALENGLLTATTLQDYLYVSVEKSLRTHVSTMATQTPWTTGSKNHEFVVADLRQIIAGREAAKRATAGNFREAIFRGQEGASVSGFSGFKKGVHTPPRGRSGTTLGFLQMVAEGDFKEHVFSILKQLREGLQLRPAEIPHKINGLSATISPPGFRYEVTLDLEENDRPDAIWRYTVTRITDIEQLKSQAFLHVVAPSLQEMEYPLATTFEFDEVVDALEAKPIEGVGGELFDEDHEYRLKFEKLRGTFTLTEGSVIVTGRKHPADFLDGLRKALAILARGGLTLELHVEPKVKKAPVPPPRTKAKVPGKA